MTYNEYLSLNHNNEKVFLIAEAGVNHENSIKNAKLMIKKAAESGCDAIKFQTYKAETLTSKTAISYWDNKSESEKSQYNLFSKYDKLTYEDYVSLKEYCDKCGIEFSTTVFDHKMIPKYSKLLSFFKVASADITNYILLEAISNEKKPVIISTGASTIAEIESAVNIFIKKNIPVSLLHCVLNYPCKPDNASLKKIEYLKKVFPDIIIGYSDHVPTLNGNLHLHVAKLLGAQIIEKHFTLDKSAKGNDHYHSFDANDIKSYREEEKFISQLISNDYLDLKSQQSAVLNARRSIVANRDIKINEKIKFSDVSIKRPGTGISPLYLDNIIGLTVEKKIKEDEPIKWENFKG